ncbi:MAG: ATP-dependent zinc metalloprotease FtsH [Candidatus Sumerlaeia bacterium]|nr:ATP-dependent zinc metalloprotease FtsH [Candidatus Sumerlaeia bacterium]
MLERTVPLDLTLSEFLTIAEAHAPAAAEGGPDELRNNAFDGEVVDKGGKIEGKLAVAALRDGRVPSEVRARIKKGTYPDDKPVPFTTQYLDLQAESILAAMVAHRVAYRPSRQSTVFTHLVLPIMLPILLILAIWLLFIRQVQSSGNKAMSFGKSRAKLIAEGQVKVSFDDVAGVEEAKEELREIVDFLKDPKKYSRLGGRIPKGVLLYGPPGTGKTLLAKAVAGEANVPFFSISGSDFVEMFVGVGASRVRDLFEQAKKSKPCLVFIDEIDAVGRHRFAGIGGGHDEREQTLNQLLVEMDGFATNEGVILIAATNRPDVLDPALLRPGRFDRQIAVDFPDVEGRLRILKVHAKNVKLEAGVDLVTLAKGTPGFSGADLANIINEAALLAARANKSAISQDDLEEAKDRVMMGPERRSMKISEQEKRSTAVHEGGHAIAARFTPGADPVHKITIIPRGRSLGLTAFLPAEEKHSRMKSELKAGLVALLGGLAAEKTVLGETGTGVSNDLQRVTHMARRMVCEFGMSERLGPRTFGDTRANVFLGRDMGNEGRDYGEDVAQIIDTEVKELVDWALDRAMTILTENRDLLDRLTNALVERETIDAEEFEMLIEGKQLPSLFKPGEGSPPNPDLPAKPKEERKPKAPPRLSDFLDSPSGAPG